MQRFTLFMKDKFMNIQSDEQRNEGSADKSEGHTDICRRPLLPASRVTRKYVTGRPGTMQLNNACHNFFASRFYLVYKTLTLIA